jgi:hypothetical protein
MTAILVRVFIACCLNMQHNVGLFSLDIGAEHSCSKGVMSGKDVHYYVNRCPAMSACC